MEERGSRGLPQLPARHAPAPGFDHVQYPGEFEARHRERNATHLEIAPALWRSLSRLAESLSVPMPAQA
jgi:L-lactate dehydrogenase